MNFWFEAKDIDLCILKRDRDVEFFFCDLKNTVPQPRLKRFGSYKNRNGDDQAADNKKNGAQGNPRDPRNDFREPPVNMALSAFLLHLYNLSDEDQYLQKLKRGLMHRVIDERQS